MKYINGMPAHIWTADDMDRINRQHVRATRDHLRIVWDNARSRMLKQIEHTVVRAYVELGLRYTPCPSTHSCSSLPSSSS
jgi:hypothetical protein